MTDNTTPMPAGEEPAKPEMPDVDEMPTAILTPNTPDDATQTMPTAVPVDEFSTQTMTTPEVDETTQAMPTDVLAAAAPTTPATQQAAPAEMFTPFSAPTEAVQPTFYPGAQPQPGDPTAFADAQPLPAYAPYATQPGQPGLSYPGQPAPVATAKRRRPLLWVALIVIVLLLVGGGTAFAIVESQMPTNTPTQVLQQFCHGFTTLNAQEVYNTFSTESQTKDSLSQLQQSFDVLKGLGNMIKFSDCKVSNVQQNNSTASGKITMTYSVSLLGISDSGSTTEPINLVLENRAWKINDTGSSTPSFTMPTMPAIPTPPPSLLTPTTSSN